MDRICCSGWCALSEVFDDKDTDGQQMHAPGIDVQEEQKPGT